MVASISTQPEADGGKKVSDDPLVETRFYFRGAFRLALGFRVMALTFAGLVLSLTWIGLVASVFHHLGLLETSGWDATHGCLRVLTGHFWRVSGLLNEITYTRSGRVGLLFMVLGAVSINTVFTGTVMRIMTINFSRQQRHLRLRASFGHGLEHFARQLPLIVLWLAMLIAALVMAMNWWSQTPGWPWWLASLWIVLALMSLWVSQFMGIFMACVSAEQLRFFNAVARVLRLIVHHLWRYVLDLLALIPHAAACLGVVFGAIAAVNRISLGSVGLIASGWVQPIRDTAIGEASFSELALVSKLGAFPILVWMAGLGLLGVAFTLNYLLATGLSAFFLFRRATFGTEHDEVSVEDHQWQSSRRAANTSAAPDLLRPMHHLSFLGPRPLRNPSPLLRGQFIQWTGGLHLLKTTIHPKILLTGLVFVLIVTLPLLLTRRTGQPTHVIWSLWVAFWAAIASVAISRLAASRWRHAKPPGIAETVRFAFRRGLRLLGTAVWGGLVVGLFIFFCATVGLVGAVPAVGPMCVGMGFGVVMGVCLICILVMSGWVLGLPLLPSALAVDAADAFDGVSRVFSYLFAAPWAYLITAVGATCFACLPAVAVMAIGRWAFFPGTQFADCLIHLNLWWSGKMATAELTEQFYRPLLLLAVTAALAFCGLCVSLTHTYLLLRRHVDGTEIEKE